MSAWLDPMRAALATGETPIAFFMRDDDAGWANSKLYALLDVVEEAGMPIDVAAIPAHLSLDCAVELDRRRKRAPGLRIHQHGFAHVNHEAEGRKCEFGASRDTLRQQADIRQGKDRLLAYLGPVDPVFTPPWNRCTQATVAALQREGFRVLSRESHATQLDLGDLADVPVSIDWRRKRDGVRTTPNDTAIAIADQLRDGATQVGLMLHHETLEADDLKSLADLMALMNAHPRVRAANIVELGENNHAIG